MVCTKICIINIYTYIVYILGFYFWLLIIRTGYEEDYKYSIDINIDKFFFIILIRFQIKYFYNLCKKYINNFSFMISLRLFYIYYY